MTIKSPIQIQKGIHDTPLKIALDKIQVGRGKGLLDEDPHKLVLYFCGCDFDLTFIFSITSTRNSITEQKFQLRYINGQELILL